MNKKILAASLALLFLTGCGSNPGSSSGSSSSSLSSSSETSYSGNTVLSILSMLNDNLTVKTILNTTEFKSKTEPAITARYTVKGVHFAFSNFDSKFKDNGLVNLGDGEKESVAKGVYHWDVDAQKKLALGDKIGSYEHYNEIYKTPALIGEKAETIAPYFVAQPGTGKYGKFDIKDEGENKWFSYLVEAFGAKETLSQAKLVPSFGTLYFAKTGNQFTFTIYSAYEGVGYDKIPTVVYVNNIGSTKISEIDDYLK